MSDEPTLLLPHGSLDARRAMAANALKPLADSLAADLDAVLAREVYLPPEKALLSRVGGRCESCGTTLEFDPFSPQRHTCPACGRVHDGALHHRHWVYPYQLWLAERVVHASVLFALRGDARHARFAGEVLRRWSDAYLTYPNRDNVLGPTRLFFSTYLESIWLLQVCVAVDLLRAVRAETGAVPMDTLDAAAQRVIAPSAALIAQYDEGFSNRQVWNNAALMAASIISGDRVAAEARVRGETGLEAHLAHGLLDDGTWYEGDNYHLFAHRGLWYGVAMAERAGWTLDPALVRRFEEGFATPFATALPDLAFPSRKDSQYAVSLRQWRYAELCELGLARRDDERLETALQSLYAKDVPSGDSGRSRSTAEAERNVAPVRLSRSDLGWRSLLFARAELAPTGDAQRPAIRSASLEGQGFTAFRRDSGEVYVGLDWGQSGGGHGHPDRLNVVFAHGATRWLDDLGTGSYVDPSLHWYRSTLAHNAPLVDGASQDRVDGRLLAYDERGGVGWILAEAEIARGVTARRALIVTPDYFVDEVRWEADRSVRFELPIHFDGDLRGATASPAALDGGDGLEDGFGFARDVRSASLAPMAAVTLSGSRDGHDARAWISASGASTVFRAAAPVQPASEFGVFHLVRCEGQSGTIRSVWAWSSRVEGVTFDGEKVKVALGEESHEHWQTPEFWQMELTRGNAHSGIELFGWRKSDAPAIPFAAPRQAKRSIPIAVLRSQSTGEWPSEALDASLTQGSVFQLGKSHYRRSEETWDEAGRPSARVSIGATRDALVIDALVRTDTPVFVPAGAENPYDNEPADINGHGVQLYVRAGGDGGAWLVVPESGHRARVRPIKGWGGLSGARAEWRPAEDGFEIRMWIPLPGGSTGNFPVSLDVIVNDAVPGRERRRGQLVLSGSNGEFVYLRGDRHEASRLLQFVLVD